MNRPRAADDRPSTSDQLPHKPTRESATAQNSVDKASGKPADPAEKADVNSESARREVDRSETRPRHPPHVTENDEDAPVQDETIAPDEVPVLPANASGRDASTVDEQSQPIDDESMYDDRPERDKDQPPSHRDD